MAQIQQNTRAAGRSPRGWSGERGSSTAGWSRRVGGGAGGGGGGGGDGGGGYEYN